MAHDVFISYPSKDKNIADAVCAKLEEKKIRCWIAPRDIPAGQNFAKSIIKAIDNCKLFVLIWSVNTNASEHILNEINQAFDQGKPIIPFRIQNVEPTDEMRYYFGRTHWLDALTPPLEKHIDTLAKVIFANLGQQIEAVSEAIPVISESSPDLQAKKENVAESPSLSMSQTGKEVIVKPGKSKKTSDAGNVQSLDNIPRNKNLLLPITAIFLVVTAILLMYFLGVFNKKPVTEKMPNDILSTLTVELSPSGTLTEKKETPTTDATSTPLKKTTTPFPAWTNNFSEPILSAIKDIEPVFQDDFSKSTYFWSFGFCDGYDPTANSGKISDGKLQLITVKCFAKASLGYIYLDNFVIQFEIDLRQVGKNNSTEFNFGNGDLLSLSGNGRWGSENCRLGTCFNRMGGNFPHSFIETDTITYISYSTKNAIYINDIPTYYFTDSNQDPGQLSFRIFSMNDTEMNSVTVDNIKIWDLDKVENISDIIK